MKKLLPICLLTLCYLAYVASAAAHPLGNFTINRFSRVDVAGDRIYVRYVVDLAEIPTFQDRERGTTAGDYAARVARGVRLRVNGRPAALEPAARRLTLSDGTGGLGTTRFELILRGPRIAGPVRVDYRDATFAGRLGWREVVAGSAPSRSRELRSYPRDLLESPLDVRHVRATLRPNGGGPPRLDGPTRQAEAGGGGLAGLVDDDLSFAVVLASLVVALFWGAAHALSPGHGKAIVAAYLVGTRGTARHALLLGLVVTVTHTIGVFALGLVTLALSQFLLPEQLFPWLNLASALLVVGVGVAVLRARYRHGRAHRRGDAHHHHGHGHGHDHEYDGGLRGLLATGISGGIIPCPTALVVLLAAISLHRIGYGLLLIVAFSVGLAAAVTAVGIVAVTAKEFFARRSFDGRVVRLLPTLSAVVVLVLGIAMTFRALPEVS